MFLLEVVNTSTSKANIKMTVGNYTEPVWFISGLQKLRRRVKYNGNAFIPVNHKGIW